MLGRKCVKPIHPCPEHVDLHLHPHRSIKINGADCGVESIILGIMTSIGGFLFGYDTGQISGMLLFVDFKNRFGQQEGPDGVKEFDSIIESLIVSLISIGCLIGALSGA